jgi:hypothetical protein
MLFIKPDGFGLLAIILLESGAFFKMSELMRLRALYFGIKGFYFFCLEPSMNLARGFEFEYSMMA